MMDVLCCDGRVVVMDVLMEGLWYGCAVMEGLMQGAVPCSNDVYGMILNVTAQLSLKLQLRRISTTNKE
jgi:hypothetical protein